MPRASKTSTKKPAPKKTRAKRRAPARKAKPKSSLWRRFLLSLFGAVFIALLVWGVWLDIQVRGKFEGKKWAIPARVYARPLEIYEGLRLEPDALKSELLSLGYRPVKQITKVGQFAQQDGGYKIFSRGFDFPDKTQSSARYSVYFTQGQVSRIDGVGSELSIRIEPKEIGSIYPNHGEDRILTSLEDIPPLLGQALIAVEDQDFAHHYGISFRGIARAMLANIKAGRFVQGGSTLTQQLVKNFYLTQEKTLWRKIQEALMAPLLELHYSKAQILEAYINEVYLGQSGPRAIHGFGLAAQHYFAQPLKQLQPEQLALLVGIVKGASFYNPWRYPERAQKRRNIVLSLMREQKLITEQERLRYAQRPLGVLKKSQLTLGDYPAFMGLVKARLQKDYQAEDLQSEGLRIFTTLSPHVQSLTESVIQKRLKKINHQTNRDIQAAALVTAVGSGEVLAMVGDRNPRYQGFNRAINMQRAVGSLVKPFVYLTALKDSDNYHLASLLDDSPVDITLPNGQRWQPQNFTKRSYGQVPMYQALAGSYNQSVVKLGLDVGVANVVDSLQEAGLKKSPTELPSLLLGALELSPLEVSELYHTLAADGVYTPLRVIRSVQDSNNQPLQRYPLKSEPRISPELSYLMHYGLQAVMRVGTGKQAYQYLPRELAVAGKTGTTNKQRDSWFAGYSADHLGVVWLGKDNNQPTPYTGSSGALPVWADIFSRLSTRSIQTTQPEKVEYYWVDQSDGLLSAQQCEGALLVPFVTGSQPQQTTDCSGLEPPVNRWLKRWFGSDSSPSNDSEDDYGEDN